jgi:hypothetical protein
MSPPWLLARHHPLGPFPRKPSAVDWRANLAYSGRALALGRRSSPADVATPYSPVCLRPESPLQLHQRPDLGAVDSDVGLHMCRCPRNCGQIDAEQLGALLQWRGDRPGVGRVVRFPSPHADRLDEHVFEHQRCRSGVVRDSICIENATTPGTSPPRGRRPDRAARGSSGSRESMVELRRAVEARTRPSTYRGTPPRCRRYATRRAPPAGGGDQGRSRLRRKRPRGPPSRGRSWRVALEKRLGAVSRYVPARAWGGAPRPPAADESPAACPSGRPGSGWRRASPDR